MTSTVAAGVDQPATTINAATATADGLLVGAGNTETLLSWRWVRDHGEDETSFDPATKQRRIYAIGADEPLAATSAALSTQADSAIIELTWPESPETTWISTATLEALLAPCSPQAMQLWHHRDEPQLSKLDLAEVLNDDAALATWLGDIDRYGFGQLGGFSGGHDGIRALANRIGYARSSIFGAIWDLSSDLSDHDDTAYSQSFLAPHTDGTYSHDAPGLQIFCCIERTGTGGESVSVDGFALADTLRTEHPEDFAVLTQVSVPAHYIEPGVELRASRPAIRLDDNGHVAQISMNNYDRSPMLLPPADMAAFYRAYGKLHELANDRDRWHATRLEPGDVIMNDNWRVLHGRLAYTGARKLVGCYLNHEDFESRLRTVG